MWSIIDKVKSQVDNTVKYVFKKEKNVVEVSYINKEDGKDIICTPTQTSCNMGCKFCHLTGLNLKVVSLSAPEVEFMVSQIVSDIDSKQDTLLISYMGAGEPLKNVNGVIDSALLIKEKFSLDYKIVRFAVASIIPDKNLMKMFMEKVLSNGLNFKFHLSLHSIEENDRKSLMPRALNIKESVQFLSSFSKNIGPTEVHYTLMDGVNDSINDAKMLAAILDNVNTTVKLLKFSPKPELKVEASKNEKEFIRELNKFGIFTEIYSPPGNDIGSSCGQFNVGSYIY